MIGIRAPGRSRQRRARRIEETRFYRDATLARGDAAPPRQARDDPRFVGFSEGLATTRDATRVHARNDRWVLWFEFRARRAREQRCDGRICARFGYLADSDRAARGARPRRRARRDRDQSRMRRVAALAHERRARRARRPGRSRRGVHDLKRMDKRNHYAATKTLENDDSRPLLTVLHSFTTRRMNVCAFSSTLICTA